MVGNDLQMDFDQTRVQAGRNSAVLANNIVQRQSPRCCMTSETVSPPQWEVCPGTDEKASHKKNAYTVIRLLWE
jgi:hypothetical protein